MTMKMEEAQAEKPKKCPVKVSVAPDKLETWHSEERLQSKKESNQKQGPTQITIDVSFPHWCMCKTFGIGNVAITV